MKLDTTSKSKAVVCFAGPRDHYEGAAALAEAGQLERLVTDTYFSDQRWLRWAPSAAHRYVKPRRHPLIPRELVTTSIKATALELFGRFTSKHKQAMVNAKDRAIGFLAAKIAERTEANLLAYSYYAGAAFAAPCRIRNRLLFQVHPPVAPLRSLYLDELQREPTARDSLMAEAEMQPQLQELECEARAPLVAQGIICASSFTQRMLVEAGATAPIKIVPYGVDASLYKCRDLAPRGKFTVAFIGALTQRKGALYLLRAIRELAPYVRLVIYTRAPLAPAFLNEFSGLDVEVKAGLSNVQLAEDITKADVMVLPSIAEGFGLAILEAMACGVPVICTHNTGGADFITHGRDGYVVPIRDVEAMTKILEQGLRAPSLFYEIGQMGRKLVEKMTWAHYRTLFDDAYQELITAADVS
jgi:hypothetical protein